MSKLFSTKMPAEPGFSNQQTKITLIYSACFLKFKHHDKLSGHHNKVSRNHVTWHLGFAEPWINTTSVFTNGMCDTDSPSFKLQTCQRFEKRISCNARISYRTSHNHSV